MPLQTQLLIAALIAILLIPLVVFWARMYQDMQNNPYLPPLWTRDAKTDWMLAFLLLNIFGAMLYYANVYRNRR